MAKPTTNLGLLFCNRKDSTPRFLEVMSELAQFSDGSNNVRPNLVKLKRAPRSNSSQDKFNTSSLNCVYKSPRVELDKLKEDLKVVDEIASCSVCLERLGASVVCCVNGHAVCERCRGQLTQCPTCCFAFSKDKHTVLSQLLEALPQCCHNEGCTQISKSIQEHEAWCGFRQVSCRRCDWKGTAKSLQSHIYSHLINIIELNNNEDWCLSLDGSKNQSLYVTAFNQLFWHVQKYMPEEGKLVIELTWLPDGLISKDMFEMKAMFEQGVHKFYAVTIVHFEPSGDDVSARFVFHRDMLQCFTDNGSIKYKLFIYKTSKENQNPFQI